MLILLDNTIVSIGATFLPDTVFSRNQLADALECTPATLEKSGIPVSYTLGQRSPRYVWSKVSEHIGTTSEVPAQTSRQQRSAVTE